MLAIEINPKGARHFAWQAMRISRFMLVTAWLALAIAACGRDPIQGPAISGTVVDMTTKKPIPRSLVFAIWDLGRSDWGQALHSDGSPRSVGPIWVDEAITDPNGRFNLPAWGPIDIGKEAHFLGKLTLVAVATGYVGTAAEEINRPTPLPEYMLKDYSIELYTLADWGPMEELRGGSRILVPFNQQAGVMDSVLKDFAAAAVNTRHPCLIYRLPKTFASLRRMRMSIPIDPTSTYRPADALAELQVLRPRLESLCGSLDTFLNTQPD